MKTSKKILSFVLAVVMALTACSVGFTAWAQEVNPADNSPFSADDASAQGSIDSLNALIDTFLPEILNLIGTDTLGNIGVDVSKVEAASFEDEDIQSDRFFEFMSELSVFLYGKLSGASRDKILNDAGLSLGSSMLNDLAYAYLEDDAAAISFWSMYQVCASNANENGSDFERTCYKYLNGFNDENGNPVPGLQSLLEQGAVNAESNYDNYYGSLIYLMGVSLEIGAAFTEDAIPYNLTIDELQELIDAYEAVNGPIPLNGTISDGENNYHYDIAALGGFIEALYGRVTTLDHTPNTLAEALYYFNISRLYGVFNCVDIDALALAGVSCADIFGTNITFDNYFESFEAYYPYATFLSDNADDLEGLTDAQKEAYYLYAMSADSIVSEFDGYKNELAKGTLLYIGAFDEESLEAEINNRYFSASQLAALKEAAQTTALDPARFRTYVINDTGKLGLSSEIKYLFTSFNASRTAPYFNAILNYDGTNDPFEGELKNQLIYGYYLPGPNVTYNGILQSIAGEYPGEGKASEAVISLTCASAGQDKLVAFDASKYPFSGDDMIYAVNAIINGYLAMAADLNATLASLGVDLPIDVNAIVDQVIAALVTTKGPNGEAVTLNLILDQLDDVYINLAKDPVSTISNLLPLLMILLDEVILPLFFNQDDDSYGNDFIFDMLNEPDQLLANLSPDAYQKVQGIFNQYGITTLNFDLNAIVPQALHWVIGDNAYTYTYSDGNTGANGTKYDNSGNRTNLIPVITGVGFLDEKIAFASVKDLATEEDDDGNVSETPEKCEAITELLTFVTKAVDDYVAAHGEDAKIGTTPGGEPATICKGLNNLLTALPVLIDTLGKNFIDKYSVPSDWDFGSRVAYGTDDSTGTTYTTAENVTLTAVKVHIFDDNKKATDIAEWLVDVIVLDWINGLLDFLNDTLATSNNITVNIPIIAGLLDSVGGLGETSVITDALNGFFALTRTSDYSFTLKDRDIPLSTTGAKANGFSSDSAFFLIGNVSPLVNFVLSLVNANKGGDDGDDSGDSTPATTFTIDFEAATSDLNNVLTQKNITAANELIDKLDAVLSALIKSTYVDGFAVDHLDGILSAVITFITNHLGEDLTNELLDVVNDYLKVINAENTKDNGTWNINSGKGDCEVDPNKVYTKKNLSILVSETYALVEKIIYAKVNINGDDNQLINGAINGIFSPSAIAIHSDNIDDDIMDCVNWQAAKAQYGTDLGYGNLSAGDKETFYRDLVESLGIIPGVIGVLLGTTGYYNNVVDPLFAPFLDFAGISHTSSFDGNATGVDIMMGIISTVSDGAAKFIDKPVTVILDFVKGLAADLSNDKLSELATGLIMPLVREIGGICAIVYNLSPTLANEIPSMIIDALRKIEFIDNLLGGSSIEDFTTADSNSSSIACYVLNNISFTVSGLKIGFKIQEVDWEALSQRSEGEILLIVYDIVVNLLTNDPILSKLFGNSNKIMSLVGSLSAEKVLNMLTEILAITQNPTEVYWTFSQYVAQETNTFSYPKGITAQDAEDAVDRLDEIVAAVFPLLQEFGVLDTESLTALVNDKLFTNDMLTKIATAVYGAIEGTGAIKFTPSQFADYLLDSSYGTTYSSAAATLKKASSWSKVSSLNWGFTDGSAKAEQGFINGLAALTRPINDLLAFVLAEGDVDIVDLLETVVGMLEIDTTTSSGDVSIRIIVHNSTFRIHTYNNAANNATVNQIKVELIPVLEALRDMNIAGENAYESAVIPLLEAFMCEGVKTYDQYVKDYNKAKDNLVIDILNPLFGFVDDLLAAPFDTLTKVLPNVAYFIDNNGLSQVLNNLLAPITQDLLGVLDSYGYNVDDLIKTIAGKDLGQIVSEALGVDINLRLSDLNSCNIQDAVLPLINSLLEDYGIQLPDFDWATIASHGTLKDVKSALKSGTNKQVIANQGEVLVAVLRYLEKTIVDNAAAITKLVNNIDAIKNNATLKNIINSILGQVATAKEDELVRAVFYLLVGQPTNKFFDYTGFKTKDYDFSYPETVDVEFLTILGPMLDGLVGGLADLNSLVGGLIYKDDIISSLAVGLYGAVEGVKVGNDTLTNLLAKTDIDFTTANVASLLMNKDYGETFPSAAKTIKAAGSWAKVNKDSLSWGVTDRDSFVHALCAVLRPLYGVLDVLLNDASLGLFDIIYLPGSDGYTSSIVPLMEALGLYNVKTQYQYRQDISKEYDAILLDILNPLLDKVEDILNAPLEVLASMIPNLALFFANDGLLQVVENLITPISALLDALEPIVEVNDLLKALNVDISKVLQKTGIVGSGYKFDIYDIAGSLKPIVGADNIVGVINKVLKLIKIKGTPLGIELMPIDWFKLASHGDVIANEASQAATIGGRVYVQADTAELLIAVLRYLVETINYKDNFNIISDLIGGLLGGNDSISDVVNQVLGMLTGDTDQVISDLCDLLQTLA